VVTEFDDLMAFRRCVAVWMTNHVRGKLSEMSDSADRELAESEIGLKDAEQWAAARTLADLGELTALWLEGTISSQ
jgi:hypothetical protein